MEKRWLSMLPSEYFARQCYVSFEPEEWNFASAAERLGVERILWASDYPHGNTTWPDSKQIVEQQFEGIPDEIKRKLTRQNAIDLYKLEV